MDRHDEGLEAFEVSTIRAWDAPEQAEAGPAPKPFVCRCGAPLTQPRTGRTRLTCCAWCRRQKAQAVLMIARRRLWLQAWQSLADRGEVSAEQAAHEVAALREDIAELSRRC